MKLIVVSDPQFIPGEREVVHALFEAGLDTFHLRKPDADERQVLEFLKMIKPAFMKRIVLHQHYPLINRYNLKGIHLKESQYRRMPARELEEMVSALKKKGLRWSCAAHDPEMIPTIIDNPAYVFLSPVFPSISKPGYMSGRDLTRLPGGDCPVIALGGIDKATISALSDKGFAGVALLGAIWETFKKNDNCEETVQVFKQIRELGNSLIWKKDLVY